MSGPIRRRLTFVVDPDDYDFDQALADAINLASFWPPMHHECVIEIRCGTIVVEVDYTSEYSRMSYAYYPALEAGGYVVIGPDAVVRPRTDPDSMADLIGRWLLASVELSDEVVVQIWNALPGEARVELSTKQVAALVAARTSA